MKPPAFEPLSTFEHSFIVERKRPKLAKPVLIVGLPGIGLVSKLAADNFVRATDAKRFASLYSPHLPNQVLALKNGRLRLFAMQFFSAVHGKRDVVVLKGDLQPLTVEGQYEVSAKILEYARGLGVTTVIAMAGYATNTLPKKPNVYCATTNKSVLTSFSKLGTKVNGRVVPIVGMAGMLPGLARIYGMKGACLLVETPGPVADAGGAKALTDVLSKFLGSNIDTSHLAKQAKKASKAIAEFEKQAKGASPGSAIAPSFEPGKADTSYIR